MAYTEHLLRCQTALCRFTTHYSGDMMRHVRDKHGRLPEPEELGY